MDFIKHIAAMAAGLVAMALSLALASCDNDCPCRCRGAHTQHVSFDWSADPGASPQGMRLWFYPRSWQGAPTPVDIAGRDGGDIAVPAGTYDVIAYNNDTQWIVFDGTDDFGRHTLSTRDADILEPLRDTPSRAAAVTGDGQRVAAPPEPVWAASVTALAVGAADTVHLAPSPLHCNYRFVFKVAGPLGHVVRASASLSGMSAGVSAGTGAHRGDVCTHPLAAVADAAAGTVSGSFCTFGVTGDPAVRNRLALYVVMDDGRAYKYVRGDNLDVTAQIRGARDPRNVTLEVGGITLPAGTGGEGAGFDIIADDWQDVSRDIVL